MLENQVLNLKAAQLASAAEIGSLRAVLRILDTVFQALQPAAPRPPFDEVFLAQRKAMLQHLLLQEPDKALAARLSELLEAPGLNFPLQWD
jgi:hypothetical protein